MKGHSESEKSAGLRAFLVSGSLDRLARPLVGHSAIGAGFRRGDCLTGILANQTCQENVDFCCGVTPGHPRIHYRSNALGLLWSEVNAVNFPLTVLRDSVHFSASGPATGCSHQRVEEKTSG